MCTVHNVTDTHAYLPSVSYYLFTGMYCIQGCIQVSGLRGQIELPKILGGGGATQYRSIYVGVQRRGGGNAIQEHIGVQRRGGGGGIIGSNAMCGGGGIIQ